MLRCQNGKCVGTYACQYGPVLGPKIGVARVLLLIHVTAVVACADSYSFY